MRNRKQVEREHHLKDPSGEHTAQSAMGVRKKLQLC